MSGNVARDAILLGTSFTLLPGNSIQSQVERRARRGHINNVSGVEMIGFISNNPGFVD